MKALTTLAALSLVIAAKLVLAGIADSPLPLLNGVLSQHVYSVPGVIRFGNLETAFMCTSAETTATIRVGVELFHQTGALQNDVSGGDGALDVSPGQTVTFVTGSVGGIAYDSSIFGGGTVRNGSARIVSTSKRIICTAMLMDAVSSPPASMTYLTIVAKTKQKAAN